MLLCLTLLGVGAGGCSTVKFAVVDSGSGDALSGVQVEGYRFRPTEQFAPDFTWNLVNVPPTDKNGVASSTNVWSFERDENEFRFVFTKAGYHPAEVLIYPGKTLVVTPADDAGWKPVVGDPQHRVGSVPTKNFESISGNGELVVRLVPEASPATQPTARVNGE